MKKGHLILSIDFGLMLKFWKVQGIGLFMREEKVA